MCIQNNISILHWKKVYFKYFHEFSVHHNEYLTISDYHWYVFFADDFEALFSGNIDDHFRIGVGVAKKSLKLYTDFYAADIILASPLGLRTIIGAEGWVLYRFNESFHGHLNDDKVHVVSQNSWHLTIPHIRNKTILHRQ